MRDSMRDLWGDWFGCDPDEALAAAVADPNTPLTDAVAPVADVTTSSTEVSS